MKTFRRTQSIRKEIGLKGKLGFKSFNFIDLFAGCGGLSLGLLEAGWNGLFAVEGSPDAFKTLKHNLIDEGDHNSGRPRFNWPKWLDKEPVEITSFIKTRYSQLKDLRGKVQLIAGGPPCQGFSFAGRRMDKDPRNELFRHHLKIVDLVRPDIVLLENVQGVDSVFGAKKIRGKKQRGRPRKSYAFRIRECLRKHGYQVQHDVIKAADFGVPQYRPRSFTVGIRHDLVSCDHVPEFFELLHGLRKNFLRKRGLPIRRYVTAFEAISDLETKGKQIVECRDPESPPGFKEVLYKVPRTRFQHLMRDGLNGQELNSMRLVNHRVETVKRFKEILKTCRKGVQLSDQDRLRLGIRKTAIALLSADLPSHTLTTLPDDLLHYAEPRVHTVREHARFQAFPDWFEFRGNYTTGGDRRTEECPRYTQVGNAVPPLLAEAIGGGLKILLCKILENGYLK